MAKIEVENVSKVFGPDPPSILPLIREGVPKQEILEDHGHVVGIRDVSLSIEAQQTFVIMGLSGSGKSTLIRHINRLIEPTAGRILVDGHDVLALDREGLLDLRRQKISMVFQRFGLLPHRTVLDNVAFGLITKGLPRKEARERALRQVELVGLNGFEDRYPRQLSGGMQQRVGLARALATDAEILLMDEAFSALDPLIRNDMQEQLRELQQRLRKTIVFITHDLDEALRLGDQIAVLKDGELRQVGTGEQILLAPADDYVERFVRDVNRSRVVTLGSVACAAPTVPIAELGAEACRRALDAAHGVLVEQDATVVSVLTRAFLTANRSRPESWWRQAANLPRAEVLDAGAPIEDALAILAGSDTPLVVISPGHGSPRLVSRADALRALVRK